MTLPVIKTKRANVIADAVRNPRIVYESDGPRRMHGDVWAACWYKQHIGQIMFDDINDSFLVWIHAGGYKLHESIHDTYEEAKAAFLATLPKYGFRGGDDELPQVRPGADDQAAGDGEAAQ